MRHPSQRFISDIDFIPDTDYVISSVEAGSDYGQMESRISLRTQDDKLIQKLPHIYGVNSIDVSSSGNYIVSTSEGETAFIWEKTENWQNQPRKIPLEHEDALIMDAQFSDDEKFVVTSYKNARVWDIRGNEISRLPHQKSVFNSQFSNDSKYVLTSSLDDFARLWSREGDFVAQMPNDSLFSGDDNPFPNATWYNTAAQFSPSGDYVATINGNTVELWNFNMDYMLSQACEVIGKFLKSNSTIDEYDRILCDGIATVEEKTELAK